MVYYADEDEEIILGLYEIYSEGGENYFRSSEEYYEGGMRYTFNVRITKSVSFQLRHKLLLDNCRLCVSFLIIMITIYNYDQYKILCTSSQVKMSIKFAYVQPHAVKLHTVCNISVKW